MLNLRTKPLQLLIILAILAGGMTGMEACVQKGCTDPNASNYDPDADKDDGSCVYDDEPQYATLSVYRYGYCMEGSVDLYLDGYFQKSFSSWFHDTEPDCGYGSADVVTFTLELGTYHLTAYSDSNINWDFYVNLSSADACYLVALKCGGIADGTGVSYPAGKGNLTVWSSISFVNAINVYVDGVYKGRVSDYSSSVPPCGEAGSLSLANLNPGVYHISASNGTYSWNNYTVLVREGMCNSFELK